MSLIPSPCPSTVPNILRSFPTSSPPFHCPPIRLFSSPPSYVSHILCFFLTSSCPSTYPPFLPHILPSFPILFRISFLSFPITFHPPPHSPSSSVCTRSSPPSPQSLPCPPILPTSSCPSPHSPIFSHFPPALLCPPVSFLMPFYSSHLYSCPSSYPPFLPPKFLTFNMCSLPSLVHFLDRSLFCPHPLLLIFNMVFVTCFLFIIVTTQGEPMPCVWLADHTHFYTHVCTLYEIILHPKPHS